MDLHRVYAVALGAGVRRSSTFFNYVILSCHRMARSCSDTPWSRFFSRESPLPVRRVVESSLFYTLIKTPSRLRPFFGRILSTMRLYNPNSCTPVVTTSTCGTWAPPKNFLPKATHSIQHEGGLLRSPVTKEKLSSKVNSDFESPTSHPRPCISPSPSTLITDNDYGVVRQPRHDILPSRNKFGFDIDDDEEGSGFYDDELSRMSSSTMSTHTTLNALRRSTEHVDTRYGIRTPFPTPSASAHHSGPPAETPKHVSVISKQVRGQPIRDALPKLKPPRDYPFPIVNPRKGASRPKTAAQKSSPSSPFVFGRKPALAKETAHVCHGDSRNKRFRCEIISTSKIEDFPCLQLAVTESTEDSSWLDFSVESKGNPFHGENRANTSPFAPIEKAPVHKSNPVLVLSPKAGRSASSASQAVRMPMVTQVASKHLVSLQGNSSVQSTPSDENRETGNGSVNDFQRIYVSTKKRPMATEPQARLSRKMGVGVATTMAATGYPSQSLLTRPSRQTSPDYTKYSSMFTVGQPLDGVKSAMEQDSVDPAIIELITLASKCSNLRLG